MNRIGIVINTKARNAASLERYLAALTEHGLAFKLYKAEPSQLERAIKHSIKHHPLLLLGGGDGSIRSAAQHCVHSSTILGILPLGTMNHFVKELGLPANAEEVVQAIIDQNSITIDTAVVNHHVFVNNSSIGFYPAFVKRRDYYSKFYNKWLSYIPTMLHTMSQHEVFALHIKNSAIDRALQTSFFMISNNRYSYQFPLTIERESFHQCELGIYFFKQGKLRLLTLLRYLFKRKTHFVIEKTNLPLEIHLCDRKKISVALDGETMEMEGPLIYEVQPKSLRLLASKP
ncbi:MAG: NAD(+)/NADH kinase [Legionellaceae bacterium]|nr:NAD(+)/NADH kinase [Legionellaceae bacterium]